MWRQSIAGDQAAAAAALLTNCRRLIETAEAPPATDTLAEHVAGPSFSDKLGGTGVSPVLRQSTGKMPVPPSKSENALGGLPPGLEKLKPAAEAAGKWRLYAIEGGFHGCGGAATFQKPPRQSGA